MWLRGLKCHGDRWRVYLSPHPAFPALPPPPAVLFPGTPNACTGDFLPLLILLPWPGVRTGPPCRAMLQCIQGALHSCMLVEMLWVPIDVLWVAMAPREVSSTTEAELGWVGASLWISHSKAKLLSLERVRGSFSWGQHAHHLSSWYWSI